MESLRSVATVRRAVVFLIAFAGVWWITAYPRAQLVAWFDLARGHHRFMVPGGYPPRWSFHEYQLLRDRYGVEAGGEGGCVVSQYAEWYTNGYNSIAYAEINRHFGKDILRECRSEAYAAYLREHRDRE